MSRYVPLAKVSNFQPQTISVVHEKSRGHTCEMNCKVSSLVSSIQKYQLAESFCSQVYHQPIVVTALQILFGCIRTNNKPQEKLDTTQDYNQNKLPTAIQSLGLRLCCCCSCCRIALLPSNPSIRQPGDDATFKISRASPFEISKSFQAQTK